MRLPSQNVLSPDRVTLSIRQRFNPTKNITADALSSAHDEFDRGNLRNAAMMWEVIEDRDDLVKAVAGKRKKNIARNGFEVVTFPKKGTEGYGQALKQKEVLEFFYDQILVTHAIDNNERGGFKLLVRQMMDAIGKKYAVHEIVWRPSPDGLTAELRFVPLWFFENTKGRLRFLTAPTATEGVELKDGAWLITTGDGIMKACAVAWMRKNLALSDWSDYSGNYGKPGIIASTTAARGAAQFTAMEEALSDFLETKSIVLNSAENVKVVDLASANPPFDPLVERMDRLISALWRGSDLSTISKSQGYGASVQQGETQILEEDDAELITETLQKNIDRRVIEYTFGPKVPILAGVTVQQTPRRGTQQDMLVDQFLIGAGMPLAITDAAKRYGRAIADPGEPTLKLSLYPGANLGSTPPKAADESQFAPDLNRPQRTNVLDQ
jgi:phage gp29-like protein